MATTALTATNLTLAEWAKRQDSDGNVPVIAELLSMTNEILQDAVFKEGNLATGERVVIRTGLPDVYFRAINQGIPPSRSTTVQVDESCAILEARSEVDVQLAKLNNNTEQFRFSEDLAFIEAMNQKMAYTMFYGNPALDPKQFLGLAPRYGSTSAGNGGNILSAGGSDAAHNTSIYLVGWGDNTIYCPFPKGTKAGLDTQNLGEQTVYNSDGTRMQALVSLFTWNPGMVVKDWRYGARIANIDTAALAALSGTQAITASTSIIKLMSHALDLIPSMDLARCAFYMNRKAYSGLRNVAMEKTSGVLAIEKGLSQFGTPKNWLSFLGVPLRKCDSIVNTESVVS
jgi:hypothetical protein